MRVAGSENRPVKWIALYLIILSSVSVYGLARIWPGASEEAIQLFGQTFFVSSEVRLILLVVAAGALGAALHGLRSLYMHRARRDDFSKRWTGWYFARPFVGALLALMIYLVFRAGLFGPQATAVEVNPFGFTALAVLVGMFSEEGFEKLKDVAEGLLKKVARDEGTTGQPVAAAGAYVFVEHLAQTDCQQSFAVTQFAEGARFPACPTCNNGAKWLLVHKS